MPILLNESKRDYQRYRHTPQEKLKLFNAGYIQVLSSNVSAVKRVGEDLIIRFHNGSLYKYTGQGDKIENLLQSNSKGKWVWKNLRRKPIQYKKIGTLPFETDINMKDEELFEELERKHNRIGEILGTVALGSEIDKATGLLLNKINVGGLILNIVNKTI